MCSNSLPRYSYKKIKSEEQYRSLYLYLPTVQFFGFQSKSKERWERVVYGTTECLIALTRTEYHLPHDLLPVNVTTAALTTIDAANNTVVAPTTPNSLLYHNIKIGTSDGDDDSNPLMCVICKDQRTTYLPEPCGHFGYCESCARRILPFCAVCRTFIQTFTKVKYRSPVVHPHLLYLFVTDTSLKPVRTYYQANSLCDLIKTIHQLRAIFNKEAELDHGDLVECIACLRHNYDLLKKPREALEDQCALRCLMCDENHVTHLIQPCKHLGLCEFCFTVALCSPFSRCPVCHSNITDCIKIYFP